ncbi:MAG: hypothetical protein IT324_12985 [Anaerolineae bacterium]|nr:hypothetical protein [Anaerolineae bacterium]
MKASVLHILHKSEKFMKNKFARNTQVVFYGFLCKERNRQDRNETGETEMITTNAAIWLFSYSVILLFSYIVVRRNWLRAYPVFLAGFVSNAIVLFFFSLERGTGVLYALVVCLIWSGFFTGAGVVMATLFRDNAAQSVVNIITCPAAESSVEPEVVLAHVGVHVS